MEPPATAPALDATMTVDMVMRRWPGTIRVMIRHRILCVGCPFGIFHTLEEASALHRIDRQALMADLMAAMPEEVR